jgi:hypothetical protein
MTTEVNNTEVNEELARLRTTLAELLQTKKNLQAKLETALSDLATAQADNATLQEQVKTAQQAVHDSIVGVPLRRMAAELSDLPELWLAEFEKRYSVEADKNGELTILSKDGKPAIGKDGKPVAFTAHALWAMLTGGPASYGKGDDGKLFATITRWHGPNGAGASGASSRGTAGFSTQEPQTKSKPENRLQLGLR